QVLRDADHVQVLIEMDWESPAKRVAATGGVSGHGDVPFRLTADKALSLPTLDVASRELDHLVPQARRLVAIQRFKLCAQQRGDHRVVTHDAALLHLELDGDGPGLTGDVVVAGGRS